MDEFRKNTEQDASEQTTPFQTPVRGADEQPGAGYQNTGASYTHTNDTADSSGFSDAGNGGSTPPPHSNAYEQWSGGKKPSGGCRYCRCAGIWRRLGSQRTHLAADTEQLL